MHAYRRRVWLTGLGLLVGAGVVFWVCTCLPGPHRATSRCPEFTPYGHPVAQAGHGAGSSRWLTVCHAGQVVALNPEHNVSDWVAFRLRKEDLLNPVTERKRSFRPDSQLPKANQVRGKDYRNTGYDRGHLAPAASMRWSEDAMCDSFYMTNVAPQVGAGFNRGIWSALERRMRRWACARGTLYVVTGPLYEGERVDKLVRDSDRDGVEDDGITVSVPTHFFKIAYDEAKKEAIAFLLPNQKLETEHLDQYLASIDEIEARARLDFLSGLADEDEARVEAQKQAQLWDEPADDEAKCPKPKKRVDQDSARSRCATQADSRRRVAMPGSRSMARGPRFIPFGIHKLRQ